MIKLPIPDERLQQLQLPARIAGIAGLLLVAGSTLMPWAYRREALDNMTYWGAPSPLQWHFVALGLIGAVLFAVPLLGRARLKRWARIAGWNSAARTAAIGAAGAGLLTVVVIAIESGGLVNTEPGVWLALAGGAVAALSSLVLPESPEPSLGRLRSPKWLQILAITLGLAAILFAAVFMLSLDDAGALVITVTTWFAFPDSFVYFGVLHAIALFSLMALPFIRAPLWLAAITAAVFIALPQFYADPLFNERAWSWLGFWVVPPPTNDLVPVFPWFGVVLLAIVATRIARNRGWLDRLALVQPASRVAAILGWLGRWSLVIYLIHQPLLLGIIYPLSTTLRPDLAMRDLDFLRACQQTCLAGGTDTDRCTTYCQCGLEGVEQNDLWNAVTTGLITAEEQALLDAQNRQCSILIYPELQSSD